MIMNLKYDTIFFITSIDFIEFNLIIHFSIIAWALLSYSQVEPFRFVIHVQYQVCIISNMHFSLELPIKLLKFKTDELVNICCPSIKEMTHFDYIIQITHDHKHVLILIY